MLILTDESDNVLVALNEAIPNGTKIARRYIGIGKEVYKSGFIIGIALSDICEGDIVNSKNLGSRYVGY